MQFPASQPFRVPCLLTSMSPTIVARDHLNSTRFSLRSASSWEDLGRTITNGSAETPCLVGIDDVRPQESIDKLRQFLSTHPGCRVALLSPSIDFPRDLGHEFWMTQVRHVSFADAHLLPFIVQSCWFGARRWWIKRLMHDYVVGPPTVNAALRRIIEQRPLDRSLSGSPPRRSISSIAKIVGVSRCHLSSLANASGIALNHLAKTWCAINALVLFQLDQVRWEEVAWRCGYETLGGLSKMLLDVTGKRLKELTGEEWFDGLQDFEKEVFDVEK